MDIRPSTDAAMPDLLGTPNIGTAMLENRDRIPFAALRRARYERVLAAMDEHDLDACIFGREANVRYVSGARRLWTAGSRPFTPSCVVVRETGAVHLLSHSASYEGIPEELAPDDIFPLTWDPAKFVAHAAATPGLSDARRIGVDGITPMFQDMLNQLSNHIELAPAEPMMRAARRRKLPAEILCIRTAAAIAESAIYEAARIIAPGVSEKQMQAAYLARLCAHGTSQFAQQGTFTAIGPNGDLRWITSERTLDDGDMVALAGGALWAGYEGSLARTWSCDTRRGPTAEQRSLHARWRETTSLLLELCRPGTTGAELHAAFDSTDAARAGGNFAVYSVGLGHEGFIAASTLDSAVEHGESVTEDMVLAVRVVVAGESGGYLGEEMALTCSGEPELLTNLGHGPLAADD